MDRGRFDARAWVRPGLTLDEVEEMKETFDLFDPDAAGRVDAREVKAALCTLNLGASAVDQVARDLDLYDTLVFADFVDLMSSELVAKDRMQDIQKVFQLFDEGLGYIDAARLRTVAQEIGERLSGEALQDMVARADSDGDGRVTLEDFYAIMTR